MKRKEKKENSRLEICAHAYAYAHSRKKDAGKHESRHNKRTTANRTICQLTVREQTSVR